MNTNRKKQVGLLLIVVMIAGLLAFATGGDVARADVIVVPPGGTWDGKTYEDLSVEWWQWALSLRANATHPLIDDYKVRCELGQDGDVWFLGGTYASGPDPENPDIILGEANRMCKEPIPAGTALFFPIINIICSEWTGDEDYPACAEFVLYNFVPTESLSTYVDGEEIENLQEYDTLTGLFYVDPMPYKNLVGAPKDAEGFVAGSGYYVLLEPLPEGDHTIEIGGEVIVPDFDGDGIYDYHFVLDVSYELTVGNED